MDLTTRYMLDIFHDTIIHCLYIWYDEDFDAINKYIDTRLYTIYVDLLSKLFCFHDNCTLCRFNISGFELYNNPLENRHPNYTCVISIDSYKPINWKLYFLKYENFFKSIFNRETLVEFIKYKKSTESIPFIVESHYRVHTATIMTETLLLIKNEIINNEDYLDTLLTSTMVNTVWWSLANCNYSFLSSKNTPYILKDNYGIEKEINCDILYDKNIDRMYISNCSITNI